MCPWPAASAGHLPATAPPHLQERVGGPWSTSGAPPEGLGAGTLQAHCSPGAPAPIQLSRLAAFPENNTAKMRSARLPWGLRPHHLSCSQLANTPGIISHHRLSLGRHRKILNYLPFNTTNNNKQKRKPLLHLHALRPLPVTSQQPELLPPLPTLSSFSGFPEQTGHNSAVTMRLPVTPSLASQAPPPAPLQGVAKGLGSTAGQGDASPV